MTGWCYRIVKYDSLADEHTGLNNHGVEDIRYEICEVFHDNGRIFGFSDACAYGDTLKDIKDLYKQMAEAFEHPVIEYRNGNFYEGKKRLKKGEFPTCKKTRRHKYGNGN